MLMGEVPIWRDASKHDVMYFLKKILPNKPPKQFDPKIPVSSEVKDFLLKLLIKNPQKRLGFGTKNVSGAS